MSIRHVNLAPLSEGPKYGLQLQKEFESGAREVWPLNVGQVVRWLDAANGRLKRAASEPSVASTEPRLARRLVVRR